MGTRAERYCVLNVNNTCKNINNNHYTNDSDESTRDDATIERSLVPTKNCEGIKYRSRIKEVIGTDYKIKKEIVWINAIGFILLHIGAAIGLWIAATKAFVTTFFFGFFISYVSGEGITIGAHRLYSHKAFKAKPVLRVILLILQTVAGQNCMYIWVRDHRQHHRFSDTDADPHNAKHGFFFSHIGWLMYRKHPAVIKYGKTIDLSDLDSDWMIMFQKKYYKTLYTIFAIFIPVAVPVNFWQETWLRSIFVCYFARYVMQLNMTWLVNSAAHLYGTRPYDRKLQPVESWIVSWLTSGEGWHNYHHAFPWDYKASELMRYSLTTYYIELLAKTGLIYDLRQASPKMINSIEVDRTCECGISNEPTNRRIVGGTRTIPHEYPWLVALMRNDRLHCGGAIITNLHVLSAGHCITFGVFPEEIEVLVGMHDRDDPNVKRVAVQSGIKHPEFTSNEVRDINDIAILTLQETLTFSRNIVPICLPKQNEELPVSKLTVAGWGKQQTGGGRSSRYLLRTRVQPVTAARCRTQNIYKTNFEQDSMLCAYTAGTDACQGDSGGPLFTEHRSGSSKWFQVGIVSWGIDCAKPNYPGVYTIVAKYINWIHQNTYGGKYCRA